MFSSYHIVDWPSSVQFFGIHLKPGEAAPFLHLPLSELHNQVVALDALWGYFAAALRERLHGAPTIQTGFALFEQLLLARLSWAPQGLDPGHSAASLADRLGFQQLVVWAGLGQVGLVVGREVSRLARHSSDWRHLLEIYALTHTLILDEEGLDDPSTFNDRFLLGLKGAMSEAFSTRLDAVPSN